MTFGAGPFFATDTLFEQTGSNTMMLHSSYQLMLHASYQGYMPCVFNKKIVLFSLERYTVYIKHKCHFLSHGHYLIK